MRHIVANDPGSVKSVFHQPTFHHRDTEGTERGKIVLFATDFHLKGTFGGIKRRINQILTKKYKRDRYKG